MLILLYALSTAIAIILVNICMKASEFMSDHAKWVEAADAFVWKNAKAKEKKDQKITRDETVNNNIRNLTGNFQK